jgi:hypothetical protein
VNASAAEAGYAFKAVAVWDGSHGAQAGGSARAGTPPVAALGPVVPMASKLECQHAGAGGLGVLLGAESAA